MALFTTTDSLSSLINAGADAMTNLYYVKINAADPDDNSILDTGLIIRSSNFTPPVFTHPVHTVNYMTTSSDIPSTFITGDKSFTLSYRIDANYDIYKWMLRQQANTSAGNLAFAATDVPDYPGEGMTVTFYAMDEPLTEGQQVDPSLMSDTFKKLWKFKYCWIGHVSQPTYTYDNSNPLQVDVKINFWDFEDPMNLLLG